MMEILLDNAMCVVLILNGCYQNVLSVGQVVFELSSIHFCFIGFILVYPSRSKCDWGQASIASQRLHTHTHTHTSVVAKWNSSWFYPIQLKKIMLQKFITIVSIWIQDKQAVHLRCTMRYLECLHCCSSFYFERVFVCVERQNENQVNKRV